MLFVWPLSVKGDPRSERDFALRRRWRRPGGRLPSAPVAQGAQMILAIGVGHGRHVDRFQLGDFRPDHRQPARRDQIGASGQRQLELGFLMLFVALAAERYAHVVSPVHAGNMGQERWFHQCSGYLPCRADCRSERRDLGPFVQRAAGFPNRVVFYRAGPGLLARGECFGRCGLVSAPCVMRPPP